MTTVIVNLSAKFEFLRQSYEVGIIPALHDALFIAQQTGEPVPGWAIDGAIKIVRDRIETDCPPGKGLSGPKASEYKKAQTDFYRWAAVDKLRKKDDVKVSDELFRSASKLLEGTGAHAGAEAVRKSYWRVNKELKDAELHNRHYLWLNEGRIIAGFKKPPVGNPIIKRPKVD